MATLDYIAPPTFVTGQIIGRANVGILVDNRDYFNGLGDRYRPVPAGVVTRWQSDTVTRYAWDGYHLHREDMDTLYYYAEIDNEAGGDTTLTGYYDYGGGGEVTMFSITNDNTASGSINLAAFDDDTIYRVAFVMTRTTTGIDATATVRAPYSIYTGALSYTTPPTITDGNVGTAAEFNKWSDNDRYFHAVTPSQAPCAGMCGETTYASASYNLYNGWDKFHPDHTRLYYSVFLTGRDGGVTDTDEITIYYDAQSTSVTAQGATASHWDFNGAALSKGNWYQVRAILTTDGTAGWRFGACKSLRVTGDGPDASWTTMGEIDANQLVYGSTAGQDTRLALLSSNDASIYDRLCWGAASPVRLDFAVPNPEFHGFAGYYYYGNYSFIRRGDYLYYRTIDGLLEYPDGRTEVLQDYDADNPYRILSLSSLDLPHGAEYTVRRIEWDGWNVSKSSQITNETLEFALEI